MKDNNMKSLSFYFCTKDQVTGLKFISFAKKTLKLTPLEH